MLEEGAQAVFVAHQLNKAIVNVVLRREESDDVGRVCHLEPTDYRKGLASPWYMKVMGLGPFM